MTTDTRKSSSCGRPSARLAAAALPPVPGGGGRGHRPPSAGPAGVPERRGGVLLCLRTGREIDTRPILERALADGKTLCVPLCVADGIMELRAVRDLKELSPGAYGILEPPADSPRLSPDQIDLAVLPCLTCSRAGPPAGPGRWVLRPLPGPLPGRRRCWCAGSGCCAQEIPFERPRLPGPLGGDGGGPVRGRHPCPAGVSSGIGLPSTKSSKCHSEYIPTSILWGYYLHVCLDSASGTLISWKRLLSPAISIHTKEDPPHDPGYYGLSLPG